jgi:hypothetical protein
MGHSCTNENETIPTTQLQLKPQQLLNTCSKVYKLIVHLCDQPGQSYRIATLFQVDTYRNKVRHRLSESST